MDIVAFSQLFWEAHDSGTMLEIKCRDGAVFVGAPQQLYFDFVVMDGLGYPVEMIREARVL